MKKIFGMLLLILVVTVGGCFEGKDKKEDKKYDQYDQMKQKYDQYDQIKDKENYDQIKSKNNAFKLHSALRAVRSGNVESSGEEAKITNEDLRFIIQSLEEFVKLYGAMNTEAEDELKKAIDELKTVLENKNDSDLEAIFDDVVKAMFLIEKELFGDYDFEDISLEDEVLNLIIWGEELLEEYSEETETRTILEALIVKTKNLEYKDLTDEDLEKILNELEETICKFEKENIDLKEELTFAIEEVEEFIKEELIPEDVKNEMEEFILKGKALVEKEDATFEEIEEILNELYKVYENIEEDVFVKIDYKYYFIDVQKELDMFLDKELNLSEELTKIINENKNILEELKNDVQDLNEEEIDEKMESIYEGLEEVYDSLSDEQYKIVVKYEINWSIEDLENVKEDEEITEEDKNKIDDLIKEAKELLEIEYDEEKIEEIFNKIDDLYSSLWGDEEEWDEDEDYIGDDEDWDDEDWDDEEDYNEDGEEWDNEEDYNEDSEDWDDEEDYNEDGEEWDNEEDYNEDSEDWDDEEDYNEDGEDWDEEEDYNEDGEDWDEEEDYNDDSEDWDDEENDFDESELKEIIKDEITSYIDFLKEIKEEVENKNSIESLIVEATALLENVETTFEDLDEFYEKSDIVLEESGLEIEDEYDEDEEFVAMDV